MNNIQAALAEITGFLQKRRLPHMVVGGLANMAWGSARLTQDIDISVALPETAMDSILTDLAEAGFAILPDEPEAFLARTKVLPIKSANGTRIDLILALLPIEKTAISRAMPIKLDRMEIPVCTPEDLIIMKAVSTRAKDADDIDGIVERIGDRLDLDYLLPIIRGLTALLERPDLDALCQRIAKIGRSPNS